MPIIKPTIFVIPPKVSSASKLKSVERRPHNLHERVLLSGPPRPAPTGETTHKRHHH